jgi:subtilisin family serine protease
MDLRREAENQFACGIAAPSVRNGWQLQRFKSIKRKLREEGESVVKRRNRMGRQSFRSHNRKPLGLAGIGKQRKRKGWTFERLEDRFVFSAQTVPLFEPVSYQTSSYSNDTLEGAIQTYLRELQWANYQAFQAGLTNTTTVDGSITSSTTSDPNLFLRAALPNDPLFTSQWHLLNTGQEVGSPNFPPLYGVAGEDINVGPVWNLGYTGEGVVVAIIDSGVQVTHPDLVANIDPVRRYNAITGTNNVSPDLFDAGSGHGTSVAGLTGATWNNLGGPVLDDDDNPVLDINGNPVFQGGGSGVAPNVTLVPIKLIAAGQTDEATLRAFQYAIQNDIDITNNSWGPADNRTAVSLTPEILQILRESVLFGRDGLGMINVWASGNGGGPTFSPGFESFGNYDSASYDAYQNSRYTISVTGVDHDGGYKNADGTFTSYPEAGSSVLVAAPTGSNVAQNVADDNGQGSGLWTTDLIGEFGGNAAPMGGFDDADLLADPDYTSRFNGTSGATPIASGVIALMLEANPNLTYRDVQEILVRSARQNSPLEIASSGGLIGVESTWQTNQIVPFQNPDPYTPFIPPTFLQQNPISDPNAGGIPINATSADFDLAREIASRYEPQPALFTNDAGYTVSQGYGVYAEQIGYAHGVIDAELAVSMAKQWHTLGQNLDPFTEKTFTTFVLQPGANIPAAERLPLNRSGLLIPGGIGGQAGFSAYWSEYFAAMPFSSYTGPPPTARGASYMDFIVPADQSMNVEWVEVRVDISGSSVDLNNLRIMLVSPGGMQSELSNFYIDDFGPYTLQPVSDPYGASPAGGLDVDGGNFTWTFTTNRSWGESTETQVIINPVTGEPLFTIDPFTGLPADPMFRDWELHIENWSGSAFTLAGLEVVWHGKDTALSAQLELDNGDLYGNIDPNWGVSRAHRIQGIIGIDSNADEEFNYKRSVQTVGDSNGDPTTNNLVDVVRRLDFNDLNLNGIYEPELGDTSNLEPFAENIVVQLFRVDPATDMAEATPTAQFLTGDDGNYYFDVDPTQTYEIRILDPLNRPLLEDLSTNALYQQHYKQVWRITPDWYYAPDRDNPLGLSDNPGEIFFGMSDANGDGIMTASPIPFTELRGDPVPMPVKNINFLIKQDEVPQEFDVTGTVYADLNGNGIFDGNDALASNVFVYWDANRNGVDDSGELRVLTDANGVYLITIPADHVDTYAVGVIPPTNQWLPTDPGNDGVENVFAGPGFPVQHVDFFLDPPADAFPDGGQGLGTIQGVVYNDLNGNGTHDPGENGIPNFRVFIDANTNGTWESGTEVSVFTASNGSYFFSNVTPASLIRLDIVIPDEGMPTAAWSITKPVLGYREIALGPGGSVVMQDFGLDNLADFDFGDLPDSYQTSLASNGARHFVTPGFQLGTSVDGEVNGSLNGEGLVGDNDDGVVVVTNSGILKKGANTLRVTVAGVGGLLTGWMDFDNNGSFDESERLTWTLAGTPLGGEADLNPGTWDLEITIPASAVDGPLASRFRWGEQGLSFAGASQIGEVEDYYLGLNFLIGDYNRNGIVDAPDYVLWRSLLTQTVAPFTAADGNGDGTVDDFDYAVWRSQFGKTLPPPGAGAGAGAGALLAGDGESSTGTMGAVDAASSSGGATRSVGGASAGSSSVAGGPSSDSSSLGTSVGNQAFAFAPAAAGTTIVSSSSSTSAANSAPTGSNLLLLDLAWSGVDDVTYGDVDESLLDSEQHKETHVSDLALAAVLNEESDWWDAI